MWDKKKKKITDGLKYNYKDYELYFALGEFYLHKNINQAYLCYENALFYCENDNDREYIENVITNVKENGVSVNPFSVVIVSYNSADIMKKCINSIRII